MGKVLAYLAMIDTVVLEGNRVIREKTKTYADSWIKRGGRGAWFTAVRPWDRLEQIVSTKFDDDVIAACVADMSGKDGSALACIRDIRNYLTLIEAEAMVRTNAPGVQPVLAAAQATATASSASEASPEPPKAIHTTVQEPVAPRVPRPLSDDGTKHHVNPAPYAVSRQEYDMMGEPDKSAYKFASTGGILSDHLSFREWERLSAALQTWYVPLGLEGQRAEHVVLDRRMLSPSERDLCMMYQPELNNNEFNHIPEGSWQRSLYAPVGDKMIMLPRFREHWAK